jgi:hypothetical protein
MIWYTSHYLFAVVRKLSADREHLHQMYKLLIGESFEDLLHLVDDRRIVVPNFGHIQTLALLLAHHFMHAQQVIKVLQFLYFSKNTVNVVNAE